eukprot:PhF_6_TR35761/c0_g1_i2/m.51958/K08516/YKT6; synaptobrevin homolog YKT6
MRLYSIVIIRSNVGRDAEPVVCTAAVDMSHINLFQRNTAREFNIFLSRSIAKTIAKSPCVPHQVVQGNDSIIGVSRHDGLVAVAATDPEYNPRVAVTMLMSILGDFSERFRSQWEGPANPKDNYVTAFQSELDQLLVKYQNPTEEKPAEIEIIVHQHVDSLLSGGSSLEELVQKSFEVNANISFPKPKKMYRTCNIS